MPRFRILKRRSWKASFRLEDIVWEVLAEAARSEKLKIADYVKSAIEGDNHGAANNSALLRVRAIQYLRQRCQELEDKSRPEIMMKAALAAPIPCFLLNSDRKLIGHNAEFHALVHSAARDQGAGSAHLALNVPIDKLMEVLEERSDKSVTCDYVIRIDRGAAPLRGKARVTLLKTGRSRSLLGYVLDAKVNG